VSGAHLDMQEASTLMAEGNRIKIDTHIIRAPMSQFSPELLDHYDLILAVVCNPLYIYSSVYNM
jgi:hypothetical protein